MPTFAYLGRTRGGQVVTGERIAASSAAAVAALRRDRVFVTKIHTVKARSAKRPGRGSSVPAKNLAVFTRQFSVMIDAGLPLVQCLEILGNQEEDKKFAEIIKKTRESIETGAGLADALREHPRAFDGVYTNMMAAGEAGGILDTVLKRLADYIEKSVKLKSQVKSAMAYPAAVMGIATVVVAAILWKVIPTFANLFQGLGATLPLPTRVVIVISNSLGTYVPFLLVGGALAAVLFRFLYRTRRGRRIVDRALLKLPVLGAILRKVAVARFCRTLGTLMTSGVPILEGLRITAKTSGNAVIEDAVMVTREAIERGETVSGPLRNTGVFPPMVTQMINVGEATGALDVMLAKIADFYEEEVDTAIAGMLTLLEPIMIAFLGVVVGGIVISMYLPMFELISQMSG